MHLATDGVLLPDPHAELGALPARSYQTTCTLHACTTVLLAIADRYMWSMVPIWYVGPHSKVNTLTSLDFVTFPNGVFSGTIISSVVHNGTIRSTGEWQLLLGAIALPGVFLGAILCDRVGRKPIMMIGFSGYLIFGLIIGCAYEQITKIVPLFIVFYGLMQSSGNFGPGNMLGLLSSESYATGVRGTCYGLSAAVGKAGAAIGTQAFQPIKNNLGNRWTFIIAAICGVVGILVTWVFVPDLSGEDLRHRDENFRAYLVSKGWDGTMGEDDLQASADQGIGSGINGAKTEAS